MSMRTVSPEPGVDLNALCAEARRRGVSYGQLVGQTDWCEQERIIKRYIETKRAAERAAREKEKAEEQTRKEREKRHLGRPRKPFDRDRARELYDQGKIDSEIALAMGCSPGTVFTWRNKAGLPPHGAPPRIDKEKAAQLYGRGLSDGQIADGLGVNRNAVRKWRTRNCLPANYAKGGKVNVKYAEP